MWRISLLRSVVVVVGLMTPGFLTPYVPSHSLLFLSCCVYARMLLKPSVCFLALSLLMLLVGDSLAGLRLGSTGIWILFLALSALFGDKYWLSLSTKGLYAGYVGHVFLMMIFYYYVLPIWSWQHVLLIGSLSALSFPWIFNGTRRYLEYAAACRYV